MLPARFEYSFLILVLGVVEVTVFHRTLRHEIRRPAFWASLTVFFLGCTLLELFALARGWWTFDETRLLGSQFIGVPLEEYLLFVAFFVLVVGLSERARDDLD